MLNIWWADSGLKKGGKYEPTYNASTTDLSPVVAD